MHQRYLTVLTASTFALDAKCYCFNTVGTRRIQLTIIYVSIHLSINLLNDLPFNCYIATHVHNHIIFKSSLCA